MSIDLYEWHAEEGRLLKCTKDFVLRQIFVCFFFFEAFRPLISVNEPCTFEKKKIGAAEKEMR